ncbi:hypothetical protein [Pseudodesulfovibrio sp. zrk46]|uniref:hypothetical protein n=1 Tax=Pseudodesulfovibrio sp. zrk46 TaxID=2725288 RepID=UPI001449CE5C|nr:hypothetical protein [Pseudodesulfovibrio sp. zrk46]QJB56159.1 hypothetical protein HFN16_06915 [Pseudodesulfovibrio sp. zrk46]
MRKAIMIFRIQDKKQPKARELAEAGFRISGAVACSDEDKAETKNVPCPNHQAGDENNAYSKKD